MARLPKGQKPEPLGQRLKRYREDLLKSGGHRLVADLDKDGAEALSAIRERDNVNIKEAVTLALRHYAKLKGQASKSPTR